MHQITNAVTLQEMRGKGFPFIGNIKEGFSAYKHCLLCGDKEEYLHFFQEILKKVVDKEVYFDFYFFRLLDEEKERLTKLLSIEEKRILNTLKKGEEEGAIYYPLKLENVALPVGISVNGWLFSTFYLKEPQCIIWSNYEGQFILFCLKDEDLSDYCDLAYQSGLKVDMKR